MANALPIILAAGAALLILSKAKGGRGAPSTPKLYYVQTEAQFRAAMRSQKTASPPFLLAFFPPSEDGMAVAQSFQPMVEKGWTVMVIGAVEASQWLQKPVQPSFTIFSRNKKVIRFGWNELAAMAKKLQEEG